MKEQDHTQGTGPEATPGDGSRRKPGAVFVSLLVAWALAALANWNSVPAAPRTLGPRTASEITRTLAEGPHAGECERCHTMHADDSTPLPYALVGPNDNSMCDGCHTQAFAGGSYGGPVAYMASAHGTSPAMIWPGPDPPARLEAGAAGKCVNCHDPHGRDDVSGPIPMLQHAREEATCLTCHDGSPATNNVRTQMQKAFRHPTTDYTGRHTGPLEALPADFGTTPLNRRHAECADCHNPHLARSDAFFPDPNLPSNTVLGASRVIPLYGPAGTPPTYTFVAGEDTVSGPPRESHLCFKCHSSWTTQPSGQTDLARVLNPANPSFHPVEAVGRNPNIQPGAFAAGWNAQSRTRCGDCHGDDFSATAGPHGSNYQYILKQPYTASPAFRTMTSNEVCFRCHSWDVYADRNAPQATKALSRFNRPGVTVGHSEHVGQRDVSCYSCHATHGSGSQPFLIATGRNPGFTTFTSSPTGGTCGPTCHGSRTYTVNYAR